MSYTCTIHLIGGAHGGCWKCEGDKMASIYDEDHCVWVTGEVCAKCGGGILANTLSDVCANCGAPWLRLDAVTADQHEYAACEYCGEGFGHHMEFCISNRGGSVKMMPASDAASMLRKAADLIEQRGKQRDREDGEKSMASTVNAFNAIYGTALTEVQGWHFMELLKMVRSAYGVYVEDDFLDKIAYAALAGEAANAVPAR